MTRVLLIVSRHYAASLTEMLRREFDGHPQVTVIRDRRNAEQRIQQVSVTVNRRRDERRRHQDLDGRLQSSGYVVIPVDCS